MKKKYIKKLVQELLRRLNSRKNAVEKKMFMNHVNRHIRKKALSARKRSINMMAEFIDA